MSEFEQWLHKMRPIDTDSWCSKQTYNFAKASWDYQQKKIDEIKHFTKQLVEVMELADECLQSIIEDDCRYDHNRNCQEHSWFGLEGDDCPISQYKRAREIQKHPMWMKLSKEIK